MDLIKYKNSVRVQSHINFINIYALILLYKFNPKFYLNLFYIGYSLI